MEKLTFKKVWQWSLVLLLFLLPWQARYIYGPIYFNGGFWEYGSLSWYATEVLLWFTIIVFAVDQFFFHHNWPHLFGKIHFRAHKVQLFITLAFIGFLALETLHSGNFIISYNFIFHVLEGLCLAVVAALARDHAKPMLLSVWFSGVVQAVLGVYQFFSQRIHASTLLGMAFQSPAQPGSFVIETATERWLRAYGSFGSPNILGGFLALTFIIGMLLYIQSRPWHKIVYTFGQSFILLGLLFSFSRGAWVAVAVGWFVIGVQLAHDAFTRKHRPLWSRFHPVSLLLKQTIFYVLVGCFTVSLFNSVFSVRFDSGYRLEQKSITERVSQYGEGLSLFKGHPFLGVGPGMYTLALFQKNPAKSVWEYQPVHNVWALIGAEWGLVGLAVWLSVLVGIGRGVFRARLSYASLFCTLLTLSLVDHFWWSLYIGQMLWWLTLSLVLLPNEPE